ncbi:hypothetical protein EV368DRAFT_85579 [Lentinula lateritia]|nr:hypothetical protein EV368DRAFT_85579 [Lentinula lateritia]
MSPAPARPISRTPSPLLPTLTALREVPSPAPESDGEVERDQLAFTIDSLSRPQLQLFKTVFNTGKLLSGYCQDDPLWLLLAEVASPCTNCSKTPNLAYSRRFLELHGTPAHQLTWGILLSVWREYDAALHARTSSTSTLLELNMLDERDTVDADQQELQRFLVLQQSEAAASARRKRDRSPMPVAGPSSKKIRSDAPKKRSHWKSPVVEANPEPPRRVWLVVPPGRSVVAPSSVPAPPRTSPSLMEVPSRDLPMQGPSDLVRLAAVVKVHSGLVRQAVSPPSARTPIKGVGQDLLSSAMPPTPRPTLVPCTFTAHPYRAENQRLVARVRLLESQLADSQRENSSLTSALRDTSHALESRQREVEQLRSSSCLVDESNALATCQRRLVEELQEEVHCARGRAAFVDQMIKEYPDEGYYEVVLPPLSQLEGDLNQARQDLRRVATFAHCLYHSDPATVLHHHHCYIGAIIEAVDAFLCRGLDSDELDVVIHNFRLALDYMQAARGVHSDLYMQSMSSIQWFFNNTVDEDEGLYRMVLEHSRFDNDGPFLMAAQHAGFAPPPDNSLEPPLHRRMLALSTALPHSAGTGMWDNIVPALPSVDQLTADWEQLMLRYIHHITDTPLSGPDTPAPMQSLEASVAPVSSPSIDPPSQVPLFLPEQESPTSPSPPPPSPTLPPLFGSVTNLAIDLTSDDDELYETEESRVGRVSVTREVVDLPAGQGTVEEESL